MALQGSTGTWAWNKGKFNYTPYRTWKQLRAHFKSLSSGDSQALSNAHSRWILDRMKLND